MSTTEQRPAAVEAPALDAPELYFNRELSWLDFNERVLALAEDEETPLLERVKFLAIYTSNLDEFVMVRVAGLHDQVDAGVEARKADGLTASETIDRIAEKLAGQQRAALARLGGPDPAGAERARHPDRHLRELRRRRARGGRRDLPGADLPGADAAGRRARAGRSRTSRTSR